MVGLPDIITIKRTVNIRGEEVEYTGVTAEGLGLLIDRFPELHKAFENKSAKEIDAASFLKLAPSIVAAVIAAGMGFPGDKKEEAKAKSLTIGEQMTLIAAIFKATFPRGLGSFMEELEALGLTTLSKLTVNGMDPASTSPPPSNGSSTSASPTK